MIKIGCPSLPFFHKLETPKLICTTTGVVLLWAGGIYLLIGLILLTSAFTASIAQWLWFKKGWRLSRSLGLKEYLLLPSNLKIVGLPPGKVFENHLQASYLDVIKYLTGIKKRPDFKQRTAEMRQSYFDDYRKIAEFCRSGRWGERIYIVGTTHPNMMKWWVRAFEEAGFRAIYTGYNIDPGAKLGKLGWWMAQVAATGRARSKQPPEHWTTCIAVWENRSTGDQVR